MTTLSKLLDRLVSTYPGGLTTNVAVQVRELQHERDSWQALAAAADADKRRAEEEREAARDRVNDLEIRVDATSSVEFITRQRAERAEADLVAVRALLLELKSMQRVWYQIYHTSHDFALRIDSALAKGK